MYFLVVVFFRGAEELILCFQCRILCWTSAPTPTQKHTHTRQNNSTQHISLSDLHQQHPGLLHRDPRSTINFSFLSSLLLFLLLPAQSSRGHAPLFPGFLIWYFAAAPHRGGNTGNTPATTTTPPPFPFFTPDAWPKSHFPRGVIIR